MKLFEFDILDKMLGWIKRRFSSKKSTIVLTEDSNDTISEVSKQPIVETMKYKQKTNEELVKVCLHGLTITKISNIDFIL